MARYCMGAAACSSSQLSGKRTGPGGGDAGEGFAVAGKVGGRVTGLSIRSPFGLRPVTAQEPGGLGA